MKSRLASVRAAGGLDRVNRAVQLLEDEWQRHGDVQLRQLLGPGTKPRLGRLRSSALSSWPSWSRPTCVVGLKKGRRRRWPSISSGSPSCRPTSSRVLSLVYEEYCLNEERGTAPDVESFCDRYPDWKSSLASQLQYHRNYSAGRRGSDLRSLDFPKPARTSRNSAFSRCWVPVGCPAFSWPETSRWEESRSS